MALQDLTPQIIDAVSDAIVVIGRDGLVLFANRQAEAMFGYSRAELVGQPVVMLTVERLREERMAACCVYFREPDSLPPEGKKVDCPGRRRDGSEFPMAITITAMETPDGSVVVGTMRDMSDYEEARLAVCTAEAAQAREKDFFKSMINSLPGVFYLFSPTGKFLRWNENLERVTGRSAVEIAAASPADFFDESERPYVAEAIAEVFKVGRSTVEASLVAKSGAKTSFLFTGKRIEVDNELCVVGMGIDITERRRAEDEVRAKDQQVRQAYVDVFSAVTGDKLVIATPEEVTAALGEALTGPYEVRGYSEMAGARAALRETMASDFPSLSNPADMVVAAGEALTNAVKHAGAGTFRVFRTDRAMQILIADSGPGIDFSLLPKAALISGFSTKQTLGMGFTIMLEYADRVLLATEEGSTVLVLEAA